MHRLLIVDDEEIIVNRLYEIFSNIKNLDLDIYKAYSGEEAIEWINRTKIDIVLSDIRMPEIDGLQLLEEIYRNWPQCRVIFLTGYNEFDYVYKAFQHNGVSYILKTEDHEKVINAVEDAVKEIEKGIKNEIKSNILNDSSTSEVLQLHNDTEAFEVLIRQKNPDLIELYLEAGQEDKFFEQLSQLFSPLKVIKIENSNILTEAYFKVSLSILSYINRWKLNEKIAIYIDLDKLMRIDKHGSWDEAVEYIFNLSKVIFRLQSKEEKKRADNAVEYIQNFIEEHLGENLSLVRLAEQVYLNPSYLSRVYKQVKGTNLSEFIDNARIKRAKELLDRENIKIYEVAKSVGYETAASFTRFFKKMSGISPQEYHEAYSHVNKR